MKVHIIEPGWDKVHFTKELQYLINNPPENYFLYEVQTNIERPTGGTVYYSAVIFYSEIPV